MKVETVKFVGDSSSKVDTYYLPLCVVMENGVSHYVMVSNPYNKSYRKCNLIDKITHRVTIDKVPEVVQDKIYELLDNENRRSGNYIRKDSRGTYSIYNYFNKNNKLLATLYVSHILHNWYKVINHSDHELKNVDIFNDVITYRNQSGSVNEDLIVHVDFLQEHREYEIQVMDDVRSYVSIYINIETNELSIYSREGQQCTTDDYIYYLDRRMLEFLSKGVPFDTWVVTFNEGQEDEFYINKFTGDHIDFILPTEPKDYIDTDYFLEFDKVDLTKDRVNIRVRLTKDNQIIKRVTYTPSTNSLSESISNMESDDRLKRKLSSLEWKIIKSKEVKDNQNSLTKESFKEFINNDEVLTMLYDMLKNHINNES